MIDGNNAPANNHSVFGSLAVRVPWVLLAWLIAVSCSGGISAGVGVPDEAAGPRAATQWHGQYSQVDEGCEVVVHDEAGWRELWVLTGQEPPQALPEGKMAIGIFLGERPSGGYRIQIERRGVRDGVYYVRYRERAPDGPAASVITRPYLIRLIPATEHKIRVQPAE